MRLKSFSNSNLTEKRHVWIAALCACSLISVIPSLSAVALPAKLLGVGFAILYGLAWELVKGTETWRWLRLSLLVAGCVAMTFSPGLGTVLLLGLLGSIAFQRKW